MTLNRASFVSALSSAAGLSASKFGLAAFADSPRHPGRRFSPTELRSDLEYLWRTLISVDPDPFRTSDAAFVKGLLKERSSALTRRMTSAEFAIAVAPVFADLNDGHVYIGASMDSVPAMSFPLIPALYGNKLIVEQGPPALPLGSEILQVENLPASVIVEKVLEITGGQTFALRQSRATANMYFVLAMLLGASPEREYFFKALLPTGQPLEIKLKSRLSSSEHRHPFKPPDYTYGLYAENKIAVITYNRCENAEQISKFLDATLLDIKRRSISALVVDIRKNLGGDSAVSDILLSRFAKRPFKQYGGTVIRSSSLIKRAYGHEQYVAEYGEQAWSAPDGKLVVTKSGDVTLFTQSD